MLLRFLLQLFCVSGGLIVWFGDAGVIGGFVVALVVVVLVC